MRNAGWLTFTALVASRSNGDDLSGDVGLADIGGTVDVDRLDRHGDNLTLAAFLISTDSLCDGDRVLLRCPSLS